MKTSNRWKQWMWGIGIGLGLSGAAHAINPDTMVVSVTPGVTYSVLIASPMVQGYVFGTVNLAATTISTVAIAVTNNGTIAEWFSLAISNTSPGNWSPQAAPGSDQFSMRAHFATSQPEDGTFTDALTTSVPGTAANLYGQSGKTNATNALNLWLRLRMPTAITGVGGAQTMTLTINGQGS